MMTHVAAALTPAGNAVAKSVRRTPKGESWGDLLARPSRERGSMVAYLETKPGPVAAIDGYRRDVSLAHIVQNEV